jgi:hypothetical protein
MALTSGPIAEQSTTFIGRESIKGITKEAEESHQPQANHNFLAMKKYFKND